MSRSKSKIRSQIIHARASRYEKGSTGPAFSANSAVVMTNSGTAMLGVGTGTGKNRAEDAAQQAAAAPLLERSIERATGIVYNTGGRRSRIVERTYGEVAGRGKPEAGSPTPWPFKPSSLIHKSKTKTPRSL